MRIALVLPLFLLAGILLHGQEPDSFPPSKPYRTQLEERGPVRSISLYEALALALRHNLEIEIEGYNREVSEANTVNAYSYYDPIAGLSTTVLSSDLPVTNILQTGGFASQITRSWSVTPSIQQNLPGGGTAALSLNLSRTSTNSDFALIDPVFGSTIDLILTQPLWRGFRRTGVERQIVVAQINQRMDDSQFRQRVAGVVEQVINAYWRLAVTVENYEAQRQRRDVAVAEFEQARKLKPPPSLTAQRSEVASHEQSLTQAEVQIIQATNAMKRLLAPTFMDPVWPVGLIASGRPDAKAPAVGLEEAVTTAMERRPELEQLRLQLKQSDAEIRFDKQETKPSVNLRVEVLSTGNAGPLHTVSPDLAVPVDLASPVLGGLGSSYRQSLKFQHPTVAAGLEIRVPVRNRAADSQLTTAVLGARKLQAQLLATQEDVMVDVRNAWGAIAAQRKSVEAAGLSRRLAEEHLTAENAKSGAAHSLDLLRSQCDVAEARVRELQALIDYQLSMVAFEKAMNTLVDDQQILLARRK